MSDESLESIKTEMFRQISEIEKNQAKHARDPNVVQALKWQKEWEERREKKRLERAQRRQEQLLRDRVTFGEETWGVSKSHRSAQCHTKRLEQAGLPVLETEQDLAQWLGIALTRLRWFTHDEPADTAWHYVRFTIPKRTGGERVILAPKSELKTFQRKILRELIEKVPPTGEAHGFVAGRSIVTNAQPHVGHEIVLNIDLKDFFPTITFPRVRGLFISLGYSFSVASVLALLCTEHERVEFESDGKTYFVSIGDRYVVQGAPTSPAIANLVARRLDGRLAGLARKHGFEYTRYADDLTFSGSGIDSALRILDVAGRIVAGEGLAINPNKTRLFRRSTRQMVTGLVVNDRLNTPREIRRRVRAIIHQARTTGLEAQNTIGHPHFRAYLAGLIAYINEGNPSVAKTLWEDLREVVD